MDRWLDQVPHHAADDAPGLHPGILPGLPEVPDALQHIRMRDLLCTMIGENSREMGAADRYKGAQVTMYMPTGVKDFHKACQVTNKQLHRAFREHDKRIKSGDTNTASHPS